MILDELAESARKRVEAAKSSVGLDAVRQAAESPPKDTGFPFEASLKKSGMSFICEVKRASPSKGVIAEDFPYLGIARGYLDAGADALSVLTEPEYFLGDDRYLREIAAAVPLPALRKDFTVDAYQIYEAKALGASAVLLICAILDDSRLREFIALADSLGLSALVEAHDAEEVRRALNAGARIIGVNNRDLRTFEVDLSVSEKLGSLIPKDVLFVAESGVSTREDVKRLVDTGADAVLIGEALMRAPDKSAMLRELRGI